MVRLATPFYTAQLPTESNRVAPKGQYLCLLKKADLKDNSKKTGQIIDVLWSVIDGAYKGVGTFDSINISNPSETAVEIGLARLNSILTIGGLRELHDTDDLVRANIIALVTLGVEEYNGREKNTIVKIENPNQQKQQAPQQSIQQQSYVAQATVAQTAPVYQQPQQSQPQQNWQQPQQQQYAPVAQPQQPVQQWQSQPQQAPVAPTIQSTQQMLNDDIPFN